MNIKSLEHLALQLKYPQTEIIAICNNINRYYHSYEKKNIGRHIDEPISDLRKILDRLQVILSRIELPVYLQGGRKGCSIFTNARIHIGQAAVLNFDIQKFFPSIHYPRVYRLFLDLECAPNVARILTRLTTYGGCVPHGSPTSSVVANLCIVPLAKRISKLAKRFDCRYSQFVDDGIISGPAYIENLRNLIDKIIKQEGFTASPKEEKRQTKYWHQEQIVTGVKVNRYIEIPQQKFNNVKKELTLFEASALSGSKPSDKEMQSLHGKIQHLKSFNSKTSNALCRKYETFAKSHGF